MSKVLYVTIITLLINCNLINSTSVNYNSTVQLFYKAENELIKYRISQRKMFNDPIEIFESKLQTINKKAPSLLRNTKIYEEYLLMMLSDNSLKKDSETNTDIIFILYHLCYDDYLLEEQGRILDSTSFILTKRIDYRTKEIETINEKYVFKKYDIVKMYDKVPKQF